MGKRIRVLFTGGTGFVGRNVIPILKEKHDIFAPTRKELNLLDQKQVETYIKKGNFDVIIHSANPNPFKNSLDKSDTMLEDSLRSFLNIYRIRNSVSKIYIIGSGAELDKKIDMNRISEDEFERSIPSDAYGFSKYIMNCIVENSHNVYNLRLFACYGPSDHESKFISHCIRCILRNEDITIRQNCYFDYIHTNDLANILDFFIRNKPKYHSYNIASGTRLTLEEIAKKVLNVMNSDKKIRFINDGFNKEYTPDISRLLLEIGDYEFTNLEEGISTLIPYEKEIFENEKKSC